MQFTFDPMVNRLVTSDPRVREAYGSVPFPGSAGCYFTDTLHRVPSIRVPTLVLHGAEDRVDPPESGRLLYQGLTCEKSLRIIPRSGHAAHLDTEKEQVFHSTVEWARTHLSR